MPVVGLDEGDLFGGGGRSHGFHFGSISRSLWPVIHLSPDLTHGHHSAPHSSRRYGTPAPRTNGVPVNARHHPPHVRTLRLSAHRNARVRGERCAAHEIRRRNR